MDIIRAIKTKRSLRTIKNYIRQGCNVNFVDHHGYSCLILAIIKNRIGVAVALINAGADPNKRVYIAGQIPDTRPLYLAILRENEYLVNKLIDAGANLLTDNNMCLHVAISKGALGMIDLLIERGANFASFDRHGVSPIDYCINNLRFPWTHPDQCLCILNHILSKGANIAISLFFPYVPMVVFEYGNIPSLHKLLDERIQIDYQNDMVCWEILRLCSFNHDKNIIRYMIHNEHLNIKITNRTDLTPLMLAAEYGNLSVLKVIVRSGANVDCIDIFDCSALKSSISNSANTSNFDYLLKLTDITIIHPIYDSLIQRFNMKYYLKILRLVTFLNDETGITDFDFFIRNRGLTIRDYYKKCMKEIRYAKTNTIFENVRYYDLIMIDKFDRKASNADLIHVVKNTRILDYLPVYGYDLLHNFKRAKKYQNLLSVAEANMYKILPTNICYNPLILNNISKFHTTSDLRQLNKL
ncbi:hypothetical protein QAD02_005727 [Eretmocerus hayati]|uniref:Uncharacterized protein n=1 Tax=Eretmocerus hayati TaxID=131215 RepID=A0ACC2NTC4_9HYME|nr:hypothetical protein QAD02_005727 [Eretmocerus hayati]